MRARSLFILAILIAATAAISACGSGGADAAGTPSGSDAANVNGPKLDVKDIASWVNSEPLSIQELTAQNKVVLVDFWTYTCVNCLRTLPFLRDWHEKYSDRGLVLLGVHSPEFDFEKEHENVAAAVEREDVDWPVALDNEMGTWRAFGNRFWPAKYLIGGGHGRIVYSHFGEGGYVETEEKIREALAAAGHDVSDIPVGTVNQTDRDPLADRVTRELYGGYERAYTPDGIYNGDQSYYLGPDENRQYEAPDEYTPQQYYLEGVWRNGREAIIHARETTEPTDFIGLLVTARSANVVIHPQGPEPFDVIIEIDDRPLTAEEAGDDIIFDEEGRSVLRVSEPRMYKFAELPEFGEHVFKLRSTSKNFAVYAFTFGIYESGF